MKPITKYYLFGVLLIGECAGHANKLSVKWWARHFVRLKHSEEGVK